MKYSLTVTFHNGKTSSSFKGFTKTFKSEIAMVRFANRYFSSLANLSTGFHSSRKGIRR